MPPWYIHDVIGLAIFFLINFFVTYQKKKKKESKFVKENFVVVAAIHAYNDLRNKSFSSNSGLSHPSKF